MSDYVKKFGQVYSYGKPVIDLDVVSDGCFVTYANARRVWVPFSAISWLSPDY